MSALPPGAVPTPRTDAIIRDAFRGDTASLCKALIPHANQLERELAAAQLAQELEGEGEGEGRMVRAYRARIAELEAIIRSLQRPEWREELLRCADKAERAKP